jgi:hypothetical protein
MSTDNYREFLRLNYKSTKQQLVKEGKPNSKKDVYGELRKQFYNKPSTESATNKDPPKESSEPELAVKKTSKQINLKAFKKLYDSIHKI